MRNATRSVLAVAAVLALLMVPLAAVAEDGEPEAAPEVVPAFFYDPLFNVLVWGFDDPAAPELLDCTLPEGATVEIGEDGEVTVLGGELPPGCSPLDVVGPQGQVNHGSIMSSLVHAIREAYGVHVGHYLRGFAKTDLGKGDQQVKGPGDPEDPEGAELDEDGDEPKGGPKGNSSKGKAKGHGKKR